MKRSPFGQKACLRALKLSALLLGAASMVTGPRTAGAQVPSLGINGDLQGKPIFPANNPWNQDISNLPVDPNSANLIASIGVTGHLHPDFGANYNGGPFGIPYIVVTAAQALVGVTFQYKNESDPGPYPIPSNAPIEGGPSSTGDRHVLVVDRDNWKLYELYYAFPQTNGTWTAGSGAIFDMNSNALRPAGWTSADAAGLPILPGLVRYDEVVGRGVINHAIRFTVKNSRRGYTYPARHAASSLTGPNYSPMGMRVRLKANFDISGFPAQSRVILQAMKTYGMIVADNGSNWYFSGTADSRWNDADLNTMKNVPGSAFEVVQLGDVITDTVLAPTTVTATAGSANISVAWNAVTNATSYNVKRSLVSGGPYTTVVSNTTAKSYVDTNVSAGTTYYYVVTSNNSTGQSYDSKQASAKVPTAGASLASLTVSPTTVLGGVGLTGTVTLTQGAPTGGAVVSLSSNSVFALVPQTVSIPAGANLATFTVTTLVVPGVTSAILTGTYGGANQTATLNIQPSSTNQAPTVSITSPSNGATFTAPASVTINATAADSDGTVSKVDFYSGTTLLGSDTTAPYSFAWTNVPAGSYALTAVATDNQGASTISTAVNITVNTVTGSGVAVSTVTFAPTTVVGGSKSVGTVTLVSAAPAGGQVVTLTSGNTSAVTVPASVTVPAGATSATFAASSLPVAALTNVTISASSAGVTKTGTLQVRVPYLSSITVAPTSVVGGNTATGTLTLVAPAGPGGMVVTLSSANSAVASVPASVTVPAGATSTTFPITTHGVVSTTAVVITATSATTKTAILNVTP